MAEDNLLELDEKQTKTLRNYIYNVSQRNPEAINPEARKELEIKESPLDLFFGKTPSSSTIKIDITQSKTQEGIPIFSDENNKDTHLWHHLVADFEKNPIDKEGEDLALMIIKQRRNNPDIVSPEEPILFHTEENKGKMLDPLSIIAINQDGAKVLKECMEHGANPNDSMALQNAYDNESQESLRILLEGGADAQIARQPQNPLNPILERADYMQRNINLDIDGRIYKQETLTDIGEEKATKERRGRRFLLRRQQAPEKPDIITDDNKLNANELIVNKFVNEITNSLKKDDDIDLYKAFVYKVGWMGNQADKEGNNEKKEKIEHVIDAVLDTLSDDVFKDKRENLQSTIKQVARNQRMAGNDFLDKYHDKKLEAEQKHSNKSGEKSPQQIRDWDEGNSYYKPPPKEKGRVGRLKDNLKQRRTKWQENHPRNKDSDEKTSNEKNDWTDKVKSDNKDRSK